MDILIQQIINGLVLGSMYALIALGYTMVYGIIQLINFAHGDVYMVGAFVGYWSMAVARLGFVESLALGMSVLDHGAHSQASHDILACAAFVAAGMRAQAGAEV